MRIHYSHSITEEIDMEKLFNRQGVERTPNAGNQVYQYVARCSRCGGMGGSQAWVMTGYTCYDCGGSGNGLLRTERLYTADRLAKLEAAANKRAAKKAAQQAEENRVEQARRDALRGEFMAREAGTLKLVTDLAEWTQDAFWRDLHADLVNRVSISENCAAMIVRKHCEIQQRQAAKEKAKAVGHAGKVGQRIEMRARIVQSKFITLVSRFPLVERYLITLETEEGHTLKWWTGRPYETGEDFETMRATVKELGEWQGTPQTTVQRVTFREA